jgi:hypothetical protein
MHPALYGALIGVAAAVVLVAAEYALLRSAASQRAAKRRVKAEFDPTERKRMISLARFSVLLPPLFAFLFWIVGS